MNDSTKMLLENDSLKVEIVPGIGGRIVSLLHKPSGHEFLWRNKTLPLRRVSPGTAYDPEFYGGIDEQIPCDVPEIINGISYPDHGELWTQCLHAEMIHSTLVLSGRLPLLNFQYERWMELDPEMPGMRVRYRITNCGNEDREFLWKLHVALTAEHGDSITCPAATAQPLDLEWSHCTTNESFAWPNYGDMDMSKVIEADGTAELLSLTGLSNGVIGLQSMKSDLELNIYFDKTVFPCCWLFASYGKLDGHHTVVLEPSTDKILMVGESNSPARLSPGEVLETEVYYRVEMADKS